jgi:hypothetical protein
MAPELQKCELEYGAKVILEKVIDRYSDLRLRVRGQ